MPNETGRNETGPNETGPGRAAMPIRSEPPTYGEDAARALAAELARRVDGEVRFDAETKALYATDASNYRQVPIGVVLPRSVDAMVETIAVCRAHGAPILPRGCGTSLAGQSCNVAVVIDASKYVNRVLEIDADRQLARIEPGTIFDDLRHRAEARGLTAGFDTSTHDYATIGGMLGNNSCGVHSVLAANEQPGSGRAEDCTESMEVVTYDGLRLTVGRTSPEELEAIIRAGGRRGEIYGGLKALRDRYGQLLHERYPNIPRRVSGYNLNQLLPDYEFNVARALVGTEGTCVTILEATVSLVESPPKRALLVIGYEDVFQTADHASDVMAFKPTGLEAVDDRLVENMRRKGLHTELLGLLPKGGGWLLAEFGGGSEEEAAEPARQLQEQLKRAKVPPVDMRLYTDKAQQEQVWLIRESGLGATAYVPGREDNWPGWEDSAVAPEKAGDYLRDLRTLFHKFGYDASLYGHFGQGCIHCRVDFDTASPEGIATWRRFLEEAADLVVRYGGSMSGEHGDGQARGELLEKMYGREIVQAFRGFKYIWDPEGKMNPGKVVDPYPLDANLRLGARYHNPALKTRFKYPDDGGSFSRAVLRCVGVGKCRRTGGGVMCPSFMVTREEAYTTRGRSRALFEMIHHPGPIEQSWRSEAVREALDLCLACKGCKSDCPVNVDMATYKAEFMAHHYKGRLRPKSAYSMGLIYWWARLASHMPGLANAVMAAPGLGAMARSLGGIARQRPMPKFAGRTFRQWFAGHRTANPGGPKVILFPDTFNNFFTTGPLIAAVAVLEDAGFNVRLPNRILCCGRPLYDEGFLGLAGGLLRQIMETLGPETADGTPVIGLEPACVSTFRDELVNLFPEDDRAQRLKGQTFTLGSFLAAHGYQPKTISNQRAIQHFHCHQHALLEKDPDTALLEAAGVSTEVLDSGCCGLAGSFGFEAEHYDVSMKCGERVLFPAARQASDQAFIVADGFSCREQIRHGAGREPLHLAEVLHRALRDGG